MDTNTLLSILILSGIFLQRSASQSEEYIAKASDRHIRKKRIIDTSHDRNGTFLHQEVPYVVRILNEYNRVHCTGSILGPRIIITAAHCIHNRTSSIATGRSMYENIHINKVVSQFVHEQYNPTLKTNDVALVLIHHPIDLIHSFHRPIKLYEGGLPSNSLGLVTGWGCTTRNSQQLPSQPLSILVRVLSSEKCQHVYGDDTRISNREICTHSISRSKCCWCGDSGAPLVIRGHLVGVFFSFQPTPQPDFPDVFTNLLHPEYRKWIESVTNYIHSLD